MKKRTSKNLKTILLCCCLLGSFTLLRAQNLDWAKQIGGTNFDDARSIASDAAGNVYSIGRFKQTADFDPGAGVYSLTATGNNYNTYILKLDAAGNFLWAKHFEGGGSEPKAMAVDNGGNVYITGFKGPSGGATDFDPGPGVSNITITGTPANTDIFVVKLTEAGNLSWVRQMGGTGTDQSTAITVDNNGNVLTTGYFKGTADFNPGTALNTLTAGNSAGDVFISKLDSAGNYVWAKNIGGTGSSACSATSIKSDGNGTVYLSGSFSGTVDFDPGTSVQTMATVMGQWSYASNMFLCKISSEGDFVWAKNAGSTSSPTASTGMLVLDNYGSIYFAGGFSDTVDFDPGPGTANMISTLTGAADLDIFISKLDTNGNYLWAKRMGGIGAESARPLADQYGKIYLVGGFRAIMDFDPSDTGIFEMNTSTAAGSMFVSKLDSAGNFEWAVSIDPDGPSIGSNGMGAVLNPLDNGIHITAEFYDTVDFDPGTNSFDLIAGAGGSDAFILKLKNCSPLSSSIDVTACDSYSFNGTLYNLSGDYIHNFVTVNGCDSTSTLRLVINSRPDASVTQNGGMLSANTGAASYQWINCNGNIPIAGATQQSFSAITNGSYAVIVTMNDCSDTSDCHTVALTGIDEVKAIAQYTVYPNPAATTLNIVALHTLHNAGLKLADVTGRVVKLKSGNSGDMLHMDISDLAPGIYILEISTGEEVSRVKIIKE